MQNEPGRHANALAAARAVVSTSGTRGLYRGMTSPLVGGALETAVNYGVRMLASENTETRTILELV